MLLFTELTDLAVTVKRYINVVGCHYWANAVGKQNTVQQDHYHHHQLTVEM